MRRSRHLQAAAATFVAALLWAAVWLPVAAANATAGAALKAGGKALADPGGSLVGDAAGDASSDIAPILGDDGLKEALEQRLRGASAPVAASPLPADPPQDATALPIGQPTFRIEVEEDGIYELSYAELQAAGMDVDAVDPATFEMLYRGQPVALLRVDDGDSSFEPGEAVRFYGQSFKGSRLEGQYITRNVYWLWAGGTQTAIGSATNPTGYPSDSSWLSSATYEIDFYYFPGWTNQWPSFPNEPDAWFIERLDKSTQPVVTTTYGITLPHPAATGPATVTVEVNSRTHPVISGTPYPHVVNSYVNGGPLVGTYSWYGLQNVNIVGGMDMADLNEGHNEVVVEVAGTTGSGTSATSFIYVNRATIDFMREYIADGDQLIFSDEVGGAWQFDVTGFGEGNAANAIAWDVTDPLNPVAIDMSGAVSGAGPYTYRIGSNHAPGATFIATTEDNMRQPVAISLYTPVDLDPPAGADWLAITHADFLTATEALETHRQDPLHGGYSTHVVDIADVLNQYGYGLPIPGAIRNFLAHSLTWTKPPRYVVLVGDGTMNPKLLETNSPSEFEGHGDFVPADLIFVDRFQGQIPADTNLVLLTGDDYVPDMAIGRIAATIPADADMIVAKIILYEENLLAPQGWSNDFAFFADNTDSGGNFCAENAATATILPASLDQTQVCMLDNSTTERNKLKNALFDTANITGTLMVNYRGHGGIDHWVKNPNLITTADAGLWTNTGRPMVILSADCLDSHFTWPGKSSLAEAFLKLDNVGSAAHWSSTGLGFSYEHDILHQAFLRALFEEGLTTMGDAILYAKEDYEAGPWDISELLAFTLHGDPAMQLMRPDMSLAKAAIGDPPAVGEAITFTLDIANNNDYPALATVTDTLPIELSYSGYVASAPVTVTVSGNDIGFTSHDLLDRGETLAITLTANLITTPTEPISNTAAVVALAGLDADPTDNSAATPICTAVPAPAPTVSIGRSGTTLNLSWTASPLASGGYEVWRSPANRPYFTPGDAGSSLLATVAGAGYDVTSGSGVGNVSDNYTYLLRAVNCAGTPSAPSNRVGEFDYELFETATSDLNWIALPLSPSGVVDTGDLALAIESGSSGAVTISSVSAWNPSAQSFDTFIHFGGGTGFNDFPVNYQNAYQVSTAGIGVGGSVVWTLVGDVPAIGSYSFTLLETATTDFNWIMLPLHLDAIVEPGQFALNIENNASAPVTVSSIQSWNAVAQGFEFFIHFGGGSGFGDLDIVPGYPYLVEIDVATGTSVTWP